MHGNVHKKLAALRCIENRFRIELLHFESESNRIIRCQEIPTPNIPPASPWSTLGSLPSWSSLENLQMDAPRSYSNQMPEPPQLAAFDAKEQQLCFKPRQSELFTPSLRLSTAIQWRKLITVACISFFWSLSKAHDYR